MIKKVGFIGCGNMAKAMIGGIVTSRLCEGDGVIASNPSNAALKEMESEFGIKITNDNKEVAIKADVLILSVKPNKYKDVIDEIKEVVKKSTIIVSIAAGISINTIENYFDAEVKVVRTMPNTPAMVKEGMTSMCVNKNVKEDEIELVHNLLSSFGKVEIVEEKLIDVVTGVAGSSPAFVYMFIEALADGAVLEGLPRDKAYKMAAQAVLGSAKMVLETGKHPGKLKDEVCSPAGTTIDSVYALEKNNFRGSIMEAVKVCVEKSKAMGKGDKK